MFARVQVLESDDRPRRKTATARRTEIHDERLARCFAFFENTPRQTVRGVHLADAREQKRRILALEPPLGLDFERHDHDE